MRGRNADASGQLAATVAALCRPATYPERVRRIKTIETHMSWVFLTDDHAYKLKKPIRTANLDNTTIGARHHSCETELRLNRRLAPDVYLSVVPLAVAEGTLRVEGTGTPMDWLVKMRRLPSERMLDVCIARGTVKRTEIAQLAAVLVSFYSRAERAAWDGPTYRDRIAADIESKRASLEQPHYGLSHADIRAVVARQERWLARDGHVLEARATSVVDAHGDLRPEHVCLEPQPVVIDCLEFDRTLRLLDPISELSFLALECRRLGAPWIGVQLLTDWAELSGDHAPAPLIPFYQSYHALVRAAVAIWHLDDETARKRANYWRERSNFYLRIAKQLW